MKTIIAFIGILLTSLIYPQNWTSVIETDIDVSSATSVDIFTNGDGNHIIVQESGSLKYYNMDVEGNNNTPVTLESTSVVSPSITGDNEDIYVVYRKSSDTYIRTKYSTNGGSSWQYLSTNPSLSNADGIESAFSNDNLHVVYEVSDDIKYSKFSGSWSSPYTVSNTEDGEDPRIVTYYDSEDDYVYFLYEKKNTDKGKWRRYDVDGNSWGTLYEGYSLSDIIFSNPLGIRATDSRLIIYYSYYAEDWLGEDRYYLNWVVRNSSNNNWINNGTPDVNNFTNKIFSTTTANDVSHSAFYYSWVADEEFEIGIWRSNYTNGYPSDLVYEYLSLQYFPDHLNLSSAGNDVHVIWQDDFGSSNGDDLRYIYDDQDPLAPQGLAVNPYQQGSNFYAKLTWQLNNEPDVFIKTTNAYSIERRIKLLDGPWGSWSVVATRGGSVTEFIDSEVQGAGAERYYAEYRMRAVDYNNHYSTYSSTVMIGFSEYAPNSLVGGGLNSANKTNTSSFSDLSYNYNLSQNYPNPFNPSTQIKYSLAQAADVTLKVYDMLGTEVANLVNETQTAGNHTYSFNAKDLSSGVYIYRITANINGRIIFTDSKQMILLR